MIWEVRRITAASLPQVVLFSLIDRFQREKHLIDLLLFTVSGIRDRLYQDPMEVQTPGQAFAAFLGALGFTRPVEQLELRSVPLSSLLFWLSRPKSSNLVEATIPAEEVRTTSACRSMAIAVSEEMLYKDRCPLVELASCTRRLTCHRYHSV